MQLMAWEAVIKAIRTHYEQENERLREENRGLGKALVQALHSQNQSAAELKGLIPSPGDLALENYDQPWKQRKENPGEWLMAGKKGMKHARSKTQEERDVYALTKIEQLIDKLAENTMLKCTDCAKDIPWKDIPSHAVTLLMKRYDKLRATKTEAEITHKSSWTDALARVEREVQRTNSEANAPQQSDNNEEPRVTHWLQA
jgi:hypothetical protein